MTNLTINFWKKKGLSLEDSAVMAEEYRELVIIEDYSEYSRKYIKLHSFKQWNKLGIKNNKPDPEFPCMIPD